MKKLIYFSIISLLLTSCFFGQENNTEAINEQTSYYADVSYLADDKLEGREIGTKGEILAAAYISKRMKAIGLTPKGINTTYVQE
ncbi:MAG: peptidase M28, partial [Putridiphycobacter sp.]|nr:peptidase M28 [Putridiphycobacter sp.]